MLRERFDCEAVTADNEDLADSAIRLTKEALVDESTGWLGYLHPQLAADSVIRLVGLADILGRQDVVCISTREQ